MVRENNPCEIRRGTSLKQVVRGKFSQPLRGNADQVVSGWIAILSPCYKHRVVEFIKRDPVRYSCR